MSAKSVHTQNESEVPEPLESFPVQVPEFYNFAYDVVDRNAAEDRNRLAMIWLNQQGQERRLTFYDFSRLSNQAANLLIKMGITRGDYVLLQLPRIPEWWVFSLAMIKIGAIQCITPTLLTPADIAYRLSFANIKLVVTDVENAPKFEAVAGECPTLRGGILVDGERSNWVSFKRDIAWPSSLNAQEVATPQRVRTRSTDPMLSLYTSGTSKHPKLVLHNHTYPLGHLITAKLWHGLGSNDLHYTVSDTGWGKNLWGNYFGQWIVGACVFIYDIRGKFHAEELLPLIDRYDITSFCAPPTIYRMLVLHDLTKFDFTQLRHCSSAGESLHTETAARWKAATGIEIREAYGQSETVCMIGNYVYLENRPGSMGQPAPGWEVELHDEDGNAILENDVEGRVAVRVSDGKRPIGLFDQYINAAEENVKCFTGGFYYTGDKAKRDADGYFWFVGRSDDIIKSSGYRIGPSEVEEAMMQHPAIHEVAVVGAPDPLRGCKVKAYVVLNPGVSPSNKLVVEIQRHTKELTAPYKYPREVEFIDALPKTYSGKIKRDLLTVHAATGVRNWEKASEAPLANNAFLNESEGLLFRN